MIFVLSHQEARRRALECVKTAPDGYVVTVKEPKRSGEQNAKMWAQLSELSEQVVWHGCKLSKEEWKDVLTAALKKQKVVPGIDSGFVVVGAHTSKMTKAEMSEMIELIQAFGAQHGVHFSDLAGVSDVKGR